jgi:hypothetical protein
MTIQAFYGKHKHVCQSIIPVLHVSFPVLILAGCGSGTSSGGGGGSTHPAISFLSIPDSTLHGLGQTISPLNLSSYVQGGTSPFTFALVSQSSSDSEVCSINGSTLSCDYSYHPGTNTVTISVTDANQLSTASAS